jgi:hypothetical protein
MRYIGQGLNYVRFSPTFGISLKWGRYRMVWSRASGFIFTKDRRT